VIEPANTGPLTLLGYTQDRAKLEPGEAAVLTTWWRVEAVPERALSLMLHLARPGQPPISIGDGLAIPHDEWQIDDILIQRHYLEIPQDAAEGSYDAMTGVYWLDTLERLPLRTGSGEEQETYTLTTLNVKR
jgi:hypothetical protein